MSNTTTTSPINPTTTTNNNNNNPHNIPPYTPMTSLSHELGILFGFLAACFVVMGVYVFFWRAAEFREERAQTLRRQMLLTRGIHHGRGGIGEKFIIKQHGHGHAHVHDGRCLDGSTGAGGGLHQRNITPENSASAGSGTMYKDENEIGVALTTGMDVGVGVVASPSLGPMTPTSTTGREIPVGGLNVGMGSRMNVNQGGVGGVGGGGAGRHEVEYGVEMDVLGFLQRGR
ncbi:uncharacterized protein BO88DRAFT_436896 [Aspergillus vadensis CBS 113365]|uniref:Uncharacterized protein n=1 Tax=Aspergillus vadensis (strain CBS 113365 / IMI 142717 / IBT 24658) TaxID=1448311 RepID=A0A319B4K9_ASPVC|nr:hypothetical protein BO88DRAFT_436896 [Aspergillus vadensis CBS 113365]PYH66791.1 hypothetical protein BO88DRAFT_436896 [Aspergillus vadensis CBS 113365]